MIKFGVRFIRLIFGLLLFAVGIVITLRAQIGYAPWEVFHVGLAKVTGIQIGTAVVFTGLVIVVITVIMGEKIGIGTLLNMLLIGTFLDLILSAKLIPVADNFLIGILMLFVGLFVIAFGSYFYIGSGFGAGPRDNLMVVLTRKTGLPVGICRGIVEGVALFIGWILGGMFGIGTIIATFAIGFCVQITFRILKFDPTNVHHETINQSFKSAFNLGVK